MGSAAWPPTRHPVPPWVPSKEDEAEGAYARSATSLGPREGAQEGGEHSAGGSDVSFLLVPGLGQPCSQRGEHSTPLHLRWGSSGLASRGSNGIPCLM